MPNIQVIFKDSAFPRHLQQINMMSNEERKAIKLALTLTAITILAFVAILVMTTISSPISDPSPFGLA